MGKFMGFFEWLNKLLKPTQSTPPVVSVDVCADVKKAMSDMQVSKDQTISEWVNHSAQLTSELQDLEDQIKAGGFSPPDPREKYWNTKYPAAEDLLYECRYIQLHDGTRKNCAVDPRIFFQPYAGALTSLANSIVMNANAKTNDEKALAILIWVQTNIEYKTDMVVEGIDEYWQFWYETLLLRSGDCEDGHILIANLLLAAGIPYWRVWLTAGWVKDGGHCYCDYIRESDDEPVVMDWCYEKSQLPVAARPQRKDMLDYLQNWFSWNLKIVFKQPTFVGG